jgi:hypothetical protein
MLSAGLNGIESQESIYSFTDDRIKKWLCDNGLGVAFNFQLFFDYADLSGSDDDILLFLSTH